MDGTQVRAESDAWTTLVETMKELEQYKRDFAPGSPEFLGLAERVADLSRVVFRISERQREMSLDAIGENRMQTPVNEIEAPGNVQEIIAAWRDAERRAAYAEPGSPEAVDARADVVSLRETYHRAIRQLIVEETAQGEG